MESVWYYARGGAQTGPLSFGDLQAAIAAGRLGAEDLVWREGTADWVAARTVAGLFATAPTPAPTLAATPPVAPPRVPAPAAFPPRSASRGTPEPLPLAEEATPAPGPMVGQSSEIVEMAKLFVRRAAAANPSAIAPTPGEDRLLSQAGYEIVTRKFAVWRRAVLWVAVVPTGFAALFRLISLLDMDTNEKAMLSPFGTLLLFIQAFALCALPFVAVFAALVYERVAKSARIVLIGGLITLVVPLLVAFTPSSWLIAGPGPTGDSELVQGMKMDYARNLGIKFYLLLMPMILSVLPAVCRACVRVKGFLPESLVPGWGLVASVPLLVFLTLSTFIAIHPFASNISLLLGLLLLIGAPLLYLTKFRLLTRPITESQDLAALAKTQLYVLATMALGILMIVIYLSSTKFGGVALLGTNKDAIFRIWSLNLHEIWLEYLGRSLFLTVLFADLLVRIAIMVWREERAFAGTGPAANFDQTMSAMGEAVETKGIPPVA